jgi:DNA repair exonuclease SbcCD nuclease subunit
VRSVIFSDLHLHPWTYGASIENGFNSRLLNQGAVLNSILLYLDEHDIKQVAFCGDFFHKHGTVTADVLRIAFNFLTGLLDRKIKSIFLIGNHDTASKEADTHMLDFFKIFGHVVEKPGMYDDLFWAMSYTEDQVKLQSFLEKTPDKAIVLLHQGTSNIAINSKGFTLNEIFDSSMVPDSAAGVFVGHYHSRFKVKDRNIWSPGSPLQLTWADSGEDRGILDITWNSDKPIEVKEVTIDSPKFVTVLKANQSSIEGNFVRVLSSDIKVKEEILNNGALSCEMVTTEEHRSGKLSISDSGNFDSLPNLVAAYMDAKELEQPIRDTGHSLMDGTYETIELKSK